MSHSEIELLQSTANPQIDNLLRGAIGVLQTVFPERIRAHYLTGSYRHDTFTPSSDLDIIVVFKDAFESGEVDRLRILRRHASLISPVRLDMVPCCETDLLRTGAVGLKLNGLLLYGADIRDELPWQPLDDFLQDVIGGVIGYLRELRGDQPVLHLPLSAPEPDGLYLGYERYGIYTGHGMEAGTRTLINAAALAATAFVGLKTGQVVGSKGEAVAAYRREIGDDWSELVETLYTRCKLDWRYRLPDDNADREQLQALCRQFNAFENHALDAFTPFILARAEHEDEHARSWAEGVLQHLETV